MRTKMWEMLFQLQPLPLMGRQNSLKHHTKMQEI